MYTFDNIEFPDIPSAIKRNIKLPETFEILSDNEKVQIIKDIISEFYGWDIEDEINMVFVITNILMVN